MMKKIIHILIMLLTVAVFLLALPPVMICKGGIVIGKATDNHENASNHIYEKEYADMVRYSTSDFSDFYFINFRFWKKLEIKEIEFINKVKQPDIKTYLSIVYVVEQNRRFSSHNSFSVTRGHDFWYFDYYAHDI